jgi:hypothetical protein
MFMKVKLLLLALCSILSSGAYSAPKCDSENGIFVGGDTPEKVHHIDFKDVNLLLRKRTAYEGGLYDKRPCNGEGFIYDKTYGFYIDTASDIRLDNCRVTWGDIRPDKAAEDVKRKNVGSSARFQPTPEQTGSIYHAYPEPPGISTPAPEGYQPFYISHYGRHGSRWMTSDERYTEVIAVFDSLYRCAGLTPLGIDVRERLHKVWENARGCSGSITPLGERQLRKIAGRMYRNFPQVFRNDAYIDARSSTSLRCVLSMSYFTERLKELNPALRVDRRAYERYMDYIAYTSPEGKTFSSDSAPWRRDFRDFEKRNVRPERLMASLVVSPEAMTGREALMRGLYWIAADMQNVDLGVSFYDIFEYEELVGIWKTVNARMYVCNAAAPLNGGLMPGCAAPLLRNILESAEIAIKKRTPTAHLRFGHDTHLIRLLALMQIEGCSNRETDMEKFHLAWQDYRISPMGANLQLIFFRNKKNDIVVKFLLNEIEVKLPLESDTSPYYSWDTVKAFLWQQSGSA